MCHVTTLKDFYRALESETKNDQNLIGELLQAISPTKEVNASFKVISEIRDGSDDDKTRLKAASAMIDYMIKIQELRMREIVSKRNPYEDPEKKKPLVEKEMEIPQFETANDGMTNNE